MATDKSLRQHYAMQGKVRNYLGKQKMVKAPVKWKSGPDHPDTELAYITKAEKDLILKADLHDSLSNGPNKGPSGIISLNSAGGSYGSPGSGTGRDSPSGVGYGGGNGGGKYSPGPNVGNIHYDPPKPSGISPQQSMAMTGNISQAGKTQKEAQQAVDRDKASRDLGTSLHGGPTVKEALDKGALKKMIRDQALEKMDVIPDDTTQLDLNKFGETVAPRDLRSQKEKDEALERSIDWDKVKKLSDKGYDFKEIQDAVDKGLLTKADPQSMKTGLLDRGIRSIRNIMPETGLQRSLLNSLTKNVFAPTTGGMFDLKKMASGALKSYGMKKLGLGWLNPYLGLASLFGFNPFKGMQTAFAKTPKKEEAIQKEIADYNKKAWEIAQAEKSSTPKGLTGVTTSQKIAMGKGLEEGAELLGLKQPENMRVADVSKMDINRSKAFKGFKNYDLDTLKSLDIVNPTLTEEELKGIKEGTITKPTGIFAAHGGRIDSPLMGRRRDI